MPRVLYDEEGNPVEGIPDEAELKEFKESKTKIDDLNTKIKELEDDVSPDWRVTRQRIKDLEKEKKDWEKRAKDAGHKEEPVALPKEDIEGIAEKTTNKVLIKQYVSRALASFGDKRDIVEAYYNKLSAGETLTEESADEFIRAAANAANLGNRKPDALRRAMAAGGAPPRFEMENGEKDYADSEEGKKLADQMGLNQNRIKKINK